MQFALMNQSGKYLQADGTNGRRESALTFPAYAVAFNKRQSLPVAGWRVVEL